MQGISGRSHSKTIVSP